MVNVVIFAFLERNGSVAPTSEFTVVNFKVVMFGQNAIGCGEFVIVFVATSFGKGAAMVFEAWGVLSEEFSATKSSQVIVSGIYIARIEETDESGKRSGNAVLRKLLVVR